MVEALVGRVEAVVQAGTRDAAGVVAPVAVGEAVRQDEVELLAGEVVPSGGGGQRGVRGRSGRGGGERGRSGGAEGGGGERGGEEHRRPSGSARGAPPAAGRDFGH